MMPAAGGAARPITTTPGSDYHPAWSPDGREIAWATVAPPRIWKVTVEGGEPVQLTASGTYPAWSADGQWIYFSAGRSINTTDERPTNQIWRVPSRGGEPERVTTAVESSSRPWPTRDGRLVIYQAIREGIPGFSAIMLGKPGEVRLAELTNSRGTLGASALATDGKFIYFQWQETTGDLWVAELVEQN
jgi:Tol biopolymer transport system component